MLKKRNIVGIVAALLLLFFVFARATLFNSGVLGASRSEDDQEVEAYFYINNTGKSSKYISFSECEEVGLGSIFFGKSIDKFSLRSAPDDVVDHLGDIPDYSWFMADNQDARWMTIYRDKGIYRVIGEVVTVEPSSETDLEEETGSDDFLLLLDESDEQTAGSEERGVPEENEEEPVENETEPEEENTPVEFGEETEPEEPSEETIPEGKKAVKAFYYLNKTGSSSKYISTSLCEELGEGTIIFDKNLDKLVARDAPDEVIDYLGNIPDYSSYIAENEDIRWMTIYRDNGVQRVIGEIVKTDLGNEAEELVEGSAPGGFSSVADMLSSNLSIGATVSTRGYYTENDGGEASYIISDKSGKIFEKLNNNLYANLLYDDSLNIKQLGAKGNGKDDDSSYLEKAFAARVANVIIPEGKFNLAGKNITVPKNTIIKGEGPDNSVLEKVNLSAPNGIDMRDIACDGAVSRSVSTPAESLNCKIMIDVSPIRGGQSVNYSNCVFRNTDIASFAFANQNGYFISDTANECIFTNIGRVAVYHSCNSDLTSYSDNSFSEIGRLTIKSGPVAAIWIGDVTNNTFTKSKNIIIQNNRLENLYTAYDFDENSVHVINANFLSLRGDTAYIYGNTIENLYGYGHDREALYTKVSKLTIDNNVIINGGTAEGYICNKSTEGDINAVITNNKFSGEFGVAICLYGPGSIKGNDIQIKHCKTAIVVGAREDQKVSYPVEVCNNTISSGAPGPCYINEEEISNYNSGNLVKLIGSVGETIVKDNKVFAGEEYTSIISVGNARKDVVFEKNEIDTNGYKGSTIAIYSTSKGVVDKNQAITIEKNQLSVSAGQKAINLNFVQQSTSRYIKMLDNTFTYSDVSVRNYPLSLSTSGTNNDTLEVSGNTSNASTSKNMVKYSAKKFINNNEGFATFSLK